MKTYLINLDRDSDRMQYMSSIFKKLDIEFERISAVAGKLITDDFYEEFCKKIQRKDWPKGGQLGCFLSHFKVWELIANGADDFALVLEDDLHFSADIKKILSNSEWLPSGFDIIRLEASTNKLLLEKVLPINIESINRKVGKLASTSWCTGAYIINKTCAIKLINIDPKLYQSVDAFLFSYEDSPVPSKLNLYQITPAVAVQDKYSESIAGTSGLKAQGFTSSIDDSYLLSEKVMFELKALCKKISFNTLNRIIKGYKKVEFKD